MKYFASLLMIILMVACGEKENIPQELKDNYSIYDIKESKEAKLAINYSNDLYRETGLIVNGIKQGPWVYYEDKSNYPKIVSNYKDGELHGPYNEFHVNKLKIKAFYLDGKLEGKYEEFKDGMTIKIQQFVNGELEGEVKSFYPESGQRMSTLNYKAGLQHGTSTYYNENGLAIQEYIYENGEQVSSREIDPDAE